tara:strand:+ start:212 stop:409 length:198 start_codon:yes stop_codon:yes gene_type:complete
MFRVGDLVCPFNHMSRVGKVIDIKMEKPKAWLVGGTTGDSIMVIVEFPNDEKNYLYRSSDLRKVE